MIGHALWPEVYRISRRARREITAIPDLDRITEMLVQVGRMFNHAVFHRSGDADEIDH